MYKILYVTGLIVDFLPKFSYVLFWLNNDRKSGTIVNVVISRRCIALDKTSVTVMRNIQRPFCAFKKHLKSLLFTSAFYSQRKVLAVSLYDTTAL